MKFKIIRRLCSGGFLLSCITLSHGQNTKAWKLDDLLRSGQLDTVNRKLTPVEDGRYKGIRISEKKGEGLVWIKGVTFGKGTVSFDVKGNDRLQGSFAGIAFHGVSDSVYDAVYFRPFNFHAADSVRRIHAVQYISHPDFGWKRLREERNAQYEKEVKQAPDPNQWFHARVVIDEKTVKVFVNDQKEPSLVADKLNTRKNGKIGLFTGDGSGGDFANLAIEF